MRRGLSTGNSSRLSRTNQPTNHSYKVYFHVSNTALTNGVHLNTNLLFFLRNVGLREAGDVQEFNFRCWCWRCCWQQQHWQHHLPGEISKLLWQYVMPEHVCRREIRTEQSVSVACNNAQNVNYRLLKHEFGMLLLRWYGQYNNSNPRIEISLCPLPNHCFSLLLLYRREKQLFANTHTHVHSMWWGRIWAIEHLAVFICRYIYIYEGKCIFTLHGHGHGTAKKCR